MVQVYQDPSSGSAARWSFREALAKGVAGTIGILTALIVDYLQKGNDSALLYATRLINVAAFSHLHMEAVSPLVYAAIIVIAGFALVYIFEPTNKRNAFYAGAGVLGFLATFAPITQQNVEFTQGTMTLEAPAAPDASGIPAVPSPAPINDDHAWNIDSGLPVIQAVYRPVPSNPSVIRAQATGVPITIMIQFPVDQGANIPQVRAWLHDNLSDRTMTLGAGAKLAQTSAGLVIVYQTIITTSQTGDTLADLALRVEADGYKIITTETTVTKNTPQPVKLQVALERSNTPLVFQRLKYPYRW